MNLNPFPRAVADLQEIEPGSPDWIEGGLHPKSYQTGGHPAYPWRHDHLVTPLYRRKVLAQYGHRPCFYLGEPQRQVSYEGAGRPVDWQPEDAFDLPDGHRVYLNAQGAAVLVNGIDLQHFHIGPLIAVYDAPPAPVKGLPEKFTSRIIAANLIRGLMRSLAGMAAKLSPAPSDYPGDRASSCVVKAIVQAGSRGLIDADCWQPLLEYYERALTIWEGPPHKYPSAKYAEGVKPAVVVNPYHYLQVYNGLFWLLPGLWMLMPRTSGKLHERTAAIVLRLSHYVEDLELLAPGGGARVSGVSFPDEMLVEPQLDWKKLKPENLHYSDNAEVWGLRAQFVAAKVLDSAVLKASSAELAKKYEADQGWCVDADGAFVGAVSVGAK